MDLKSLIRRFVPHVALNCIVKISRLRLYWVWKWNGCPVPPPHLAKQYIINEYREKFGVEVLVETGTYEGETVQSQLKNFKKIFSIEVARDLYQKAMEKFRGSAHVALYSGDSGDVLKTIVPGLGCPSLFWLDGHYSGGVTGRGVLDTPIKEELKIIFGSKFPHVILIDDARCFDGKNGYPSLSELEEWVSDEKKYFLVVKDDIIRLTPCRRPGVSSK